MNIEQFLCQTFSSKQAIKLARLQTLWSGYGEIARYEVQGLSQPVIVKHIAPPSQSAHPYQWDSDLSHQRKMRSYQVELSWYKNFSGRCQPDLNLPALLAAHQNPDNQEMLLVLSDLDAAGFNLRHDSLTLPQLYAAIDWLASFHGQFAHEVSTDSPYKELWPIGTYWHLATRPEELAAMADSPLKQVAAEIDTRLNLARFQTLVHGDAKVANFCFHDAVETLGIKGIAALDFQYVGAGIGIKDFIYLLGSCLDEYELFQCYRPACEHYFKRLKAQLEQRWSSERVDELITEWRSLLPFAWADFERFLAGWQPLHHKRNAFSHQMTERALDALNGVR
ncbi:aminoglycoside phosphotransferase family protein [Shewanella insulae]|uniref:phosphotransferase n=1 Tax=Shewanella insulae TaxID=2681496 RepID=UPI001EFE155C|nr:phosphotransferase [Shewanella insulae]MCG9755651.1 aminoglycoside phosphotransferase family protein [Shewanella insulae]